MTRTEPYFRCFVIDALLVSFSLGANSLISKQAQRPKSVDDALELARCAVLLFTGAFPWESPHSFWGASRPLPWQSDFRTFEAKKVQFDCKRAKREINICVVALQNEGVRDSSHEPWLTASYNLGLQTHKSIVQHMMAEVLLDLDEFITRLLKRDAEGAIPWLQAANANMMEAMCLAWELMGDIEPIARRAAIAKHKKDPRQLEKAFVRQCFTDWRATPSRYKSKAAFARDMLDKCTHLASQKKIEDWVREWDRNQRGGGTLRAG